MQLEVILPLVAYLVVVFGISVYAMRKRSTGTFLNEYFLGSRSMGGIVLAMTLTATYISASSFIGGPGAAYKYGLGWVLLAMIQLPAVWLSLGILGKKFAILARRYNAVTLNDMLFARYQSRLLVWLASLSLLVAFVGAMTVQFIGGARLLETAAGIPYETGLLIFGISIALYTAFGGFRASVLNDTMQGLVMLIGTVVLLIGVVHAAGGLSNAVQTLQTIDPQLVTPQGADDILSPAFMTSFWVLVCFGVIGLPHTAVRCISYKDSKAVHRGIIIGTIVVAILMFGMHPAGALGRAVIPDLTVPDLVIPTLMVKVLPPFAAGIFLAAPMAAIMSTINAQLLQSSATIIKDLYLNIRPDQMQNETRLEADVGGNYVSSRRVAAACRLEAARNDHLAEFVGLRWAGSRFPVHAGAGSLLGTRQRQRRAKCDDRWRRAVCRTRDAEYSVPGLPPYRALVTTKFAGFPGRKPFRYIRPASYRFDY